MAIRIPVKALADFMTGSAAVQRTVLKNNKFPKTHDGHTRPQIVRYSEAKTAIKKYHQSGNDLTVLLDTVERLSKKSAIVKSLPLGNDGKQKDSSRLDDNIRALNGYMKFFSGFKFTVLTSPKLKYTHGNIDVAASLDLYVQDGGEHKLIKLDLSATVPKPEAIQIIVKVACEAANAGHLPVLPRNVIYVDVERKSIHNGSKLGKSLKKNIDAACENIEALWPTIKQGLSS